jgi:hypothetical protein
VPPGAAVRRRERKRRIRSARQERLLDPAAANLVSAPAAHAPAPLPKPQREIVQPRAPEQKLPSAHPEPRLEKKHRKKTAKEMKTQKKGLPAGSSPPTNEELDLWATQLAVRGVWPPASAKQEDDGKSDSQKISTLLKPTKEMKEQNNHVEKEMMKKVAIQPVEKRTRADGEAEDANFEEVGKVEVGQRKRKRSDGREERERKKGEGEREGGIKKEREREEISEPSAASTCFGSIKESQALISRFHTLQKYLAAVDVDPTLLSEAAREKRRCEIRAKLEALGGLDAYQKASIFGAEADESGAFNSGVWVKNELRNMGLLPPRSPARLRLLDVGALQDHWSQHADTVAAMVSIYSVLPLESHACHMCVIRH